MYIPSRASDQEVLDALAPLLRAEYEEPAHSPDGVTEPQIKTRWGQGTLRELLTEAILRRRITHREVASRAEVPGLWLIGRLPTDDISVRAEAYRAEIHHLERALAAVHAARAVEVWRLDRERQSGEPGALDKIQLAEAWGVTRPTLDKWIKSGERALSPTAQDAEAAHAGGRNG